MNTSHSEIPEWLKVASKGMGRRSMGDEGGMRYIHVTELLNPPHQVRLKDRYFDDLEQDPMDMVSALIGTAFHEYLAEITSEMDGVREETHSINFHGWTIIGTPDWHDDTTIRDYKTTRMWSKVFGKPEWEEQLNVYAWLLAEECPHIDTLEVHAIYTDWSRAMAQRNADMPKAPVEVIPVTTWYLSDTEKFVRDRLDAIEAWEGICTPGERWERGEHWAVMKEGRKKALKRCDSLLEAEAIVAKPSQPPYGSWTVRESGLSVEHRPGTPTRCLHYCPVKKHCSFGRNLESLW